MLNTKNNGQNQIDVALVMGSKSDWATVKNSADLLDFFDVKYHPEVVSAHRTPEKMYNFATNAAKNGIKVIIAAAGGAAHLPGMIAALTHLPVLGIPVKSSILSGVDSLHSIVQMPKGVAVGTLAIGDAGAYNAALLAVQILALNDEKLEQKLIQFRQAQTQDVLNNPDPR